MDPIADMLNRIRNAQAVLKPAVDFSYSNLKYEIGKILEKEKLIQKVEKKGRKGKKIIEITLKYEAGLPVISGLKRISKLGQRIYTKSRETKPVKGGYGIAIISTPEGLMTNKQARKRK